MKINPVTTLILHYIKATPFYMNTALRKRAPKSVLNSFTSLGLLILLSACGNVKNATYFDSSAGVAYVNKAHNLEPTIGKNDILSITVSSIDPESTEIFNVKNKALAQASTDAANTPVASGYLVDQDGFIRFPILGSIAAAGKSKKELREELTTLLVDRKLLLDPIVDIRYLNFKVSVLGEVKNPSVLNIANEKISFLEALGLAGDITIFGKRDNVTLIREQDGLKRIHRIDLTTNDIFNSPFYYLQSNDIIYVEPNKSRVASASLSNQWIPVVLSAISLAIITVTTFNN